MDYLHVHGPAYLPVHLHPAGHILAGYLQIKGKTADICYSSIDALNWVLKQDKKGQHIIDILSTKVDSVQTYKKFVEAKLQARKILQQYTTEINKLFTENGRNEIFDYVHNHIRYTSRFNTETIEGLIQTAQHPEASIFAQYIEEELIPYLIQTQPKAIGFTITDKQQASFPLVVAGLIKNKYHTQLANTKIGLGGYLASINKDNLLNNAESKELFNYIDFVIHNEGEKAIDAYVDYLHGKKTIDQVPKLIYKHNDQIIANSLDDEGLIVPDKMAYLESEDINSRPYYNHEHLQKLYLPSGGEVSLVMIRGCPFPCSFCGIPSGYDKKATYIDNEKRKTMGKQPLQYTTGTKNKNFLKPDITPVKEVFGHMQYFYNTLGVKIFSFSDERLPPQAMRELAQLIIDNNMTDIRRSGYNILDKEFTDPAFCALIAKAGFQFPQFGLETISTEALKASKKGQNIATLQQQEGMFKTCTEHGIRPHVFLMIGLPRQNNTDLLNTIAYLQRIGKNILTIKPTTIKITKASMDAIKPENVGIILKENKDFGANILFENDTKSNIPRISRNLIDARKIVIDQWIALRHTYNPVTKHLSYTQRLHTGLDTVVQIAQDIKDKEQKGTNDPTLYTYDGDPFELGEETINKAYKKVISAIIEETTNNKEYNEESIIQLSKALYLISDKNFVEQILKKYIHNTTKRNEMLEKSIIEKNGNNIQVRTEILTKLEIAGEKELQKIFPIQ